MGSEPGTETSVKPPMKRSANFWIKQGLFRQD